MDDGLTIELQLQRLSTIARAPYTAGAGPRLDLMSRARTTATSPMLCIEPNALTERNAFSVLTTCISTPCCLFAAITENPMILDARKDNGMKFSKQD